MYLFQPFITKICRNFFNCFELMQGASEYNFFLLVSPNFRFWDSFHKKRIYYFALLGILIWRIIFPLTLLNALVQHSKKNVVPSTKIQTKFKNNKIEIHPADREAMK